MYVVFRHTNGQEYTVEAAQVIVHADNGDPCSVVYEHGSMLVCSDVNHPDFKNTCSALKIKRMDLKTEVPQRG